MSFNFETLLDDKNEKNRRLLVNQFSSWAINISWTESTTPYRFIATALIDITYRLIVAQTAIKQNKQPTPL